jgi:hypothetical protein
VCLLLILSNKLDLNQETHFTIGPLMKFASKVKKIKLTLVKAIHNYGSAL